jgi:CIC family chloride channel protein
MAPLFTIGSGLGAWLGSGLARWVPSLGVDARMAGLVGMAAIFAGASHALLTSIVFAFETTRQPVGLLPLLLGCSASYFVALMWSPHSIMTEKLARRGVNVRSEYAVDYLSRILVADVGIREVVMLRGSDLVASARDWLATVNEATSHQGFPVLDDDERLLGVVTRRDLLDPNASPMQRIAELIRRPPVVVFDDNTLRDAADQMVIEKVGRLPVVRKQDPRRVIGIISRSDLLSAHAPRLQAERDARRVRSWNPTVGVSASDEP